VLEQYTDSEK